MTLNILGQPPRRDKRWIEIRLTRLKYGASCLIGSNEFDVGMKYMKFHTMNKLKYSDSCLTGFNDSCIKRKLMFHRLVIFIKTPFPSRIIIIARNIFQNVHLFFKNFPDLFSTPNLTNLPRAFVQPNSIFIIYKASYKCTSKIHHVRHLLLRSIQLLSGARHRPYLVLFLPSPPTRRGSPRFSTLGTTRVPRLTRRETS